MVSTAACQKDQHTTIIFFLFNSKFAVAAFPASTVTSCETSLSFSRHAFGWQEIAFYQEVCSIAKTKRITNFFSRTKKLWKRKWKKWYKIIGEKLDNCYASGLSIIYSYALTSTFCFDKRQKLYNNLLSESSTLLKI